MDIKLKYSNTRKRAGILSVMLAFAIITVSFFPRFYHCAREYAPNYFEEPEFARALYANGFVVYLGLQQEMRNQILDSAELFAPQAYDVYRQNNLNHWTRSYDYMEYVYNTAISGSDTVCTEQEYYRLETLFHYVNRLTANYDDMEARFHSDWRDLDYYAVSAGGKTFGEAPGSLERLLGPEPSEELSSRLKEHYTFYIVLNYGAAGEVRVGTVHGARVHAFDYLTKISANDFWDSLEYFDLEEGLSGIVPPKNFSVVYAVPAQTEGTGHISDILERYNVTSFGDAGLSLAYWVCLALIGLAAFIMGLTRFVTFPFMDRLHLEAAVFLGALSLYMFSIVRWFGYYGSQEYLTIKYTAFVFSGDEARLAGYLMSIILLMAGYILIYFALYPIGLMIRKGPAKSLKNQTLTAYLLRWCGKVFRKLRNRIKGWGKGFYRFANEIDLAEPGNKLIIKALSANFLALLIPCSPWLFGIVVLVIYTVVLFIIARGFARGVNKSYASILHVTGQLAKGRLDVPIGDDLGIFEHLGGELKKVQRGFQRVVSADMKSWNMKARLITNASQDLKAPLALILTSIDQLRDESLSPQERRTYVQALDKESRCLKALISDLLEISGAISASAAINLAPVDIIALIRQVKAGAKDKIADSKIEFHHHFPPEPIILELDREKTFKIIEILILNVTKHALAHTRAYIDVSASGEELTVVIKNVSHGPLDFDIRGITEGLIRGDRSRSANGGGPGDLAIASSLAGLQGGELRIETDGDLFKALLVFPLSRQG